MQINLHDTKLIKALWEYLQDNPAIKSLDQAVQEILKHFLLKK